MVCARDAQKNTRTRRAREVKARGLERRRLGRLIARRCRSTAPPTVPACRSPSPARGPSAGRGRRRGRARAAAPDGIRGRSSAWWKSKASGSIFTGPAWASRRRRHVVIGAERAGDVLEGAGVARRRDQALRVERTGERTRRACRRRYGGGLWRASAARCRGSSGRPGRSGSRAGGRRFELEVPRHAPTRGRRDRVRPAGRAGRARHRPPGRPP